MDENIKKYVEELKHMKDLGILPIEDMESIDKALSEIDKMDNIENLDEEYRLPIKFINKSDNNNPHYAKEGDSGFDFRANNSGTLGSLERMLVPTGLYFELPDGYELQIRPRSGLAYKNGVTVLNTPGTVDTGYRGEIKILLVNLSKETFSWDKGDRVAQGVIAPRVSTEFGVLEDVVELTETDRGSGGFGSTGIT